MNLPARMKLWQIDAAGVAVCALLAFLWYAAGLQPLSQAKAARQNLISELDAREQKADRADSARRAAAKTLAEVRTRIDEESVPLAPADEATRCLAGLSALAAKHALTIDQLKPGSPTPSQRFTTIPISIAGSGRATDLARFLHDLRSRFPDVGITGLDIRAEPENPERPAHFAIAFVWYAASSVPASKK